MEKHKLIQISQNDVETVLERFGKKFLENALKRRDELKSWLSQKNMIPKQEEKNVKD